MIKNKIIQRLNKHTFFLIFYMILLSLALIPYYINGTVILGGEGDFVLDFSTHLCKFSFMWFSDYGTGTRNLAASGNALNILALSLIEKLTGSVAITNFLLIFSIYFFPFLGMYLVCKEMKVKPFISFAISFFYVVNPFTLYYLTCINQWNVFAVTVMPMFFWIILKYYHNNFKLFFFFGFISTCFSFAYSNAPMLVIIHISIILSMITVSYYRNEKLILSQIFKKYSIVLISFIIFNLWWILNLFTGFISTAKKIYSASWAQSWLNAALSGHRPIIARLFSLTAIIAKDSSYDFFAYWYNTIFAKLITLIPILMVIYFVLIAKNKRTRNLLNLAIFSTLLLVLFFVKGNSGLFGFIYDFMFKYVPFFNIFKSPVEKFGLLYVFIFSVLLLFVLKGLEGQKYFRFIMGIFTVCLIFCSMPILTGNIIPDYKIGDIGYCSRKYKDKDEYKQFRQSVNNDNVQYRVFSLPSYGNYQICISNYNNKKYTGFDPILMNINKSSIADHHRVDVLFNNISSNAYAKLLGIYNIKKIIINEDIIPWFGTLEEESVPELKRIFDRYMTEKNWGSITLYDNQNYFLPHIYTSENSN